MIFCYLDCMDRFDKLNSTSPFCFVSWNIQKRLASRMSHGRGREAAKPGKGGRRERGASVGWAAGLAASRTFNHFNYFCLKNQRAKTQHNTYQKTNVRALLHSDNCTLLLFPCTNEISAACRKQCSAYCHRTLAMRPLAAVLWLSG